MCAFAFSLKIVARIGAIERLVAKRKVSDDVALDHGFEQRPLEAGRVAQVAALDTAVEPGLDPDQHVAAEALDQRHTFAYVCHRLHGQSFANRPGRKLLQDLVDDRHALLDLPNANPDAGVHVTLIANRHFELQLIVRWISWHASRVERAPRSPPDETPGPELPRKLRRQDPGPDGAVLQGGGIVVQLCELGKVLANMSDELAYLLAPVSRQIDAYPAGHDAVHHEPVAETKFRHAQYLFAQKPALR